MSKTYHKTTVLLAAAILVAILLSLVATGKPAKAAFPAKNGKIVFASVRDGKDALYTARPEGSNVTMVPNSTSSDSEPVFSPDGRKIAFRSARHGDWEIYRMRASDGSGQTNLTNNPALDFHPAWQPLP